jgi:hypothetical protein
MDQKLLRKSKKKLYQEAFIAHEGHIKPCGASADWEACYTLHNDRLYFWYNTSDDSTHVINTELNSGNSPTGKA